jgi:aspartyl-tRNA(Asn)/glutamyl-tRNA(Gln) amidotransferase subunit A
VSFVSRTWDRSAICAGKKKSFEVTWISMQAPSDALFLSIEQAARLLKGRKLSPVELVDLTIERIEKSNASINAFITVTAESARKQAKQAERDIRRSGSKTPLHGVPISLKDNIFTRGIRTTAGSKILSDFVPQTDSEIAARLAAAGAILIGKTNLHEFAYGITSENPHFGPVRNPWAHDRISGGSSGGSAASVACGMGFASVGTDTGGSCRIPPSLCGIVGLKPTFGSVSLDGVVPLATSLDHAGMLARSVTDACIVFEAIAGKYPRGIRPPDYRKLRAAVPKRVRLGWPKPFFFDRVDGDIRAAIDAAAKTYESLGARIVEVVLPRLVEAVEPSTDIALAEATYYHQSQGYFPARANDYGPDVRGRLEAGSKVSAVAYLRAFEVKRSLEKDFDAAFEQVDAILAPASPIPAPRIGENEAEVNGKKDTVRSLLVGMCRPANFTGLPAISVPCGFTSAGLPVGLQLIGPRWQEQTLLAIARLYEEATPWHEKHPDLV